MNDALEGTAGTARSAAPAADAAAHDAIVMTYRVDAELLYETMIVTGRKMMARRDPASGKRSGWRALGIWAAILIGLAALIDAIRAADLKMEILYVLLGIIFGFAFYTVFLNRSYKRLARMMTANPIYSGELTATLDPSGVEIRTESSLNRLDWTAVEGALQLKTAIALMVPNDMIPLPDAALPHGVTRADLLARIEHWRLAAGAASGSAG